MSDPFALRPGEKFFEEQDYANTRALRKAGNFDKAERLLLRALPVPAVLDELRMIASAKARLAKKQGDWAAVYRYLEGYNEYASKVAARSIAMVNQAPPEHTTTDTKMLEEAKSRLGKR